MPAFAVNPPNQEQRPVALSKKFQGRLARKGVAITQNFDANPIPRAKIRA
ncbi:MAG: hypothetical protein ACUVUF_08860 [Candidatus Bathycorpusculaceae bacterium]